MTVDYPRLRINVDDLYLNDSLGMYRAELEILVGLKIPDDQVDEIRFNTSKTNAEIFVAPQRTLLSEWCASGALLRPPEKQVFFGVYLPMCLQGFPKGKLTEEDLLNIAIDTICEFLSEQIKRVNEYERQFYFDRDDCKVKKDISLSFTVEAVIEKDEGCQSIFDASRTVQYETFSYKYVD